MIIFALYVYIRNKTLDALATSKATQYIFFKLQNPSEMLF